jgi:hypothetical protein
MHYHPTTSGSSHLLEGVFLGVSHSNKNQNALKLSMFVADFGSVPGSQLINGLRRISRLTLKPFVWLFVRRRLARQAAVGLHHQSQASNHSTVALARAREQNRRQSSDLSLAESYFASATHVR